MLATTAKQLAATVPSDQDPARAGSTAVKPMVGLRRQANGAATQASHFDGGFDDNSIGTLSILEPGRRQEAPAAGSGRVGAGAGVSAGAKFRLSTHQQPHELHQDGELVVAAHASVSGSDRVVGQSRFAQNRPHQDQGGLLYSIDEATAQASQQGAGKLRHQDSFGDQVFIAGTEAPSIAREVTTASTQRRMTQAGNGTDSAPPRPEQTTRYEVLYFDGARQSRSSLVPNSSANPVRSQTSGATYSLTAAIASGNDLTTANLVKQEPFGSQLPGSGPDTGPPPDSTDVQPDFSGSYIMTSYQSSGAMDRAKHDAVGQRGTNSRRADASDISGSAAAAPASAPLWFSISKDATATRVKPVAAPSRAAVASQGIAQKKRSAPATMNKDEDAMMSPWETGDSDNEDDLAFAASAINQHLAHPRDGAKSISAAQQRRAKDYLPHLQQTSHVTASSTDPRVTTAPSLVIFHVVGPSHQRQQVTSRVSPLRVQNGGTTSTAATLQISASTPSLPGEIGAQSDLKLTLDRGLPLLATSLSVTAIRDGGSPIYPSGSLPPGLSPVATQRARASWQERVPADGFVLSDAEIEGLQTSSRPSRRVNRKLDKELVGRQLAPLDDRNDDDRSGQRPFSQPPLRGGARWPEMVASSTTECGRLHTAPSPTALRLDKSTCRGRHDHADPIKSGHWQQEEDEADAVLLVNDEKKVATLDPRAWEREVTEKASRKSPSRADMMRRRLKYSFGK